jgi:hypothetical protein
MPSEIRSPCLVPSITASSPEPSKHTVERWTRLTGSAKYAAFFAHCDDASLVESIAAKKAHTEDDIFHIEPFASGALGPRFQVCGDKQTYRQAATTQ